MQQFEGLWDQLHVEDGYARHISAGPCEALYEAKLDRVGAENKNDRDRPCRCLGGKRRWGGTTCDNHGHLTAHQFARQTWQTIIFALGPAVLDRDIPPLDVAGFTQPLTERGRSRRSNAGRGGG